MDTVPGIDTARLATVQVYDRGAQSGKEHRGQGLLLDLDDQGILVLTCHHVIAPVAKENLYIRIREANDQLSDLVPVQYDEQRSQPGRDAVVLHVDRAHVPSRPRPLLHTLNPKTYAGSLRATGLTYMEPGSFDAHVGATTRLEIPVDISGNWPDPPTRYVLPVAYRLANPTDARPGISGGVVLVENGVLGLVHFSRGAAAHFEREAYLVPLSVWAEGLPELAELIEPLIYDKTGRSWSTQLTRVSQLRSESFKLGDTAAATFPYIITPVEDTYNHAVQALYKASDEAHQAKHGILVLGESNAGKTRLILEALSATLPSWSVFRWRPDYTKDDIPPIEFLSGKRIVLFIDDLQDYTVAQTRDSTSQFLIADPRTIMLRTLVETLLQAAQRAIIVSTCRTENQLQAQAALGWLFVQLMEVSIPSFSPNAQDSKAARTIAEFQKRGPIHIEDWDGTLGSLVLGLSTKNSQYLALPPLAVTVLRAMKLLNLAYTNEYTKRRLQAVCAGVFVQKRLLEDEQIWQETIDILMQVQFVEEIYESSGNITLTIRKDAYFEQVVTDYPRPHRPNHLERDLVKLRSVFEELKDAQALSSLGLSLHILKRFEEAVAAFDHALTLDPDNALAWSYKSLSLLDLKRFEEAVAAFDHALTLDPDNDLAWFNRGFSLLGFTRALTLDPDNALAWLYKGLSFLDLDLDLEPFEEAVAVSDHALTLDPDNALAWSCKSLSLLVLGRFEEAVAAFDHALTLDPDNADIWRGKADALRALGQEKEARKAERQAKKLHG